MAKQSSEGKGGNSKAKGGKKGGNNSKHGGHKAKRLKRPTEIVFDPEARKEYLRGFSERKKQRRVFGLAMQKVKDRKAKLEQRAEMRKAVQEQIQEAEEQKNNMISAALRENNSSSALIFDTTKKLYKTESSDHSTDTGKSHSEKMDEPADTIVQIYEDGFTQTQWGGEVIVTTTTDFHSDNEDDNEEDVKKNNRVKNLSKDTAQEYSGKVERYMQELKGNLPSKKKKDHRNNQPTSHRGKHGAANMQGMSGDGNLKIAKKMLSRTQPKVTGPQSKKHGGKKHKR